MHPLLSLAVNRPQLLVRHAVAYADLAQAELGVVALRIKRRALLGLVGGLLLTTALILTGVAVMLCAVLAAVPGAGMAAPGTGWALVLLWLVPAIPAIGAVGCALAMRQSATEGALEGLQSQWRADVALWQEVGAQ